VPLSAEGFAQIPEVVGRLKEKHKDVKAVYSSSLERASILATAIAHEYGLTVTKLPELRSWDYGVLNGRRVSDVLDVLGTLSTGAGRDLAPKAGESMNDFLERYTKALSDIIYHAPEEGVVLVVTHLQNIMMGGSWLKQGLPDVQDFAYEYSETNEIPPGSTLEFHREWTNGVHS
jgi:broad specificity phosphatase PhoE